MKNLAPTDKVSAVAVGSCAATIIIWAIGLAYPHLVIPPEVATAFGGVLGFIAGYLRPES